MLISVSKGSVSQGSVSQGSGSQTLPCVWPQLLCCLLLTFACLLPAVAVAQEAADGKDGEKVAEEAPTFDDSAVEATFQEGKAHFASTKWKDAEKCFKSCKREAKGDQKKLIATWIDACKGGKKLARVEKLVAKESWKKAWKQFQPLDASYGKTPLAERLDSVRTVIEQALFLILATYEEPPPEMEITDRAQAQGASINDDPKYVRGGKRSLKWDAGAGPGFAGFVFGQVPICQIDGDKIGEFPYLHISIYSPTADFGKFTLYFGDPATLQGADPTNILRTQCFFYHMTVNKQGWLDVRIDLRKQAQTLSAATWQDVTHMAMLVIPPSKPKTIYIDNVRLEKK
ncbi:MAG: hypothetical protein AAF581_11665 [Planctomycetota bacterium]